LAKTQQELRRSHRKKARKDLYDRDKNLTKAVKNRNLYLSTLIDINHINKLK
jgi:hypothetical protein